MIETPFGPVAESELLDGPADYAAAVERLRMAAQAYYLSERLLMDDASYDALARVIAASEIRHPEWVSGVAIHTQVGAGTGAGDIAHSAAMLSLDNVFSAEELSEFLDRVERTAGQHVSAWSVEPKFDGLAIAASYVDGRLMRLVTRGDGHSGEDVTHAAPQVRGLPAQLARPTTLEIRGEILMTDADFARANEIRVAHGEATFANPRNAAAGSLRARGRDYQVPLSFFAYTLLEDGRETRDQSASLAYAAELGISVSDEVRTLSERADVLARVAEIGARRGELGLPIDGAVIKVDSLDVRRAVGSTSRAPRWAIAYKYAADTRVSELLDIVVGVGRTGNLSFTAVLAPVEVGGVVVTSASVHNPSVIAAKGLRLSDPDATSPRTQKVWVWRAGEVIPEITGPVDAEDVEGLVPFAAPTSCPNCGGPLDTSSLIWRCQRGRACATEAVIAYAVSRDCLDIEGLGETHVRGLVSRGLVTKVSDLFELDRGHLLTLDRVGEKLADRVLANIVRARELPMNRVFCSLGVTMTGRSMSRRLARHFGTMARLRAASFEELQSVEGVGPERARSILAEIADLASEFDYLEREGIGQSEPDASVETPSGVLAGQVWVVTGTMTGPLAGNSRESVHALLESLGATCAASVSSRTTTLLVGEKAGSKADKARALGVRVMDEREFATTYL